MNWTPHIIGIVLAAQAMAPALAQGPEVSAEKAKLSTDKESLPKPKRKPMSAVVPDPAEAGHAAAIGNPTCQSELRILGGEFSVPSELPMTGECRVVDGVQLKSISTPLGPVDLPAEPILGCGFALRFSFWVAHIAAPVIAGLSDAKLAAISTDPGYQCRGRNGDSSGKISEHAFGNAIDIDGLVLSSGKRVEIPDAANREHTDHSVLMALRMSACGYFTTVLGPGSNAAHESHFHFDLGKHGKNGDYRICE